MTTLLYLTFETLPEVFNDPIVVRNPLRENAIAYRVHKDCEIEVCGKTMCADLVKLPMNEFDIILCIERFHK